MTQSGHSLPHMFDLDQERSEGPMRRSLSARNFRVADTIFPEATAKNYTREQWEAALDNAEQRAEPDQWPLIVVDDFY